MPQRTVPGQGPATVTEADHERLTAPASVDGVIGSPADSSIVYADNSGLQVKIRADKEALVRGQLWLSGDTDFTVPISANASGQTRTDRVVLRLDRSTWQITAEVVEGTPGAGAPALTQDPPTTGVWELLLADVTVPNGVAVIGASQVTRRETYVSEQPILCTSATRPPHKPGRIIFETDSGQLLLSVGGAWRAVVASESTAPVSIVISSSTPPGTPTVGRIWIRPTGA